MISKILEIVKARLNRNDTALDAYLTERIGAVIGELADTGIYLRNTPRDIVFAADMVCWQYSNREKREAMPDWLRLARRERWLAEGKNNDT
jgi:hypothetical protein